MNQDRKLWFKRKTFGWGWTPCSWEGWAITLGYLVLVLFFISTVDETSSIADIIFLFILPLAIITLILIEIAYKKGEKPRWQWGSKKDDN